MKKLVENLLSWCKKSMKMRRCVGKSTAPVTGQSVGQTGNAEGVLPSTATETVDEIVLPAAVETAGMVETIDEKAAFGKSGRKKPENMLDALQRFLTIRYDFRYNLLTEQTEYRGKEMPDEEYAMVAQRDLNTFCLEARTGGINCWDKDVSRLLHSRKVENYHPFLHYMSHLPQWDGVDRVTPLAVRISRKPKPSLRSMLKCATSKKPAAKSARALCWGMGPILARNTSRVLPVFSIQASVWARSAS